MGLPTIQPPSSLHLNEALTWQVAVWGVVVYLAALALYRITWHPLSHIPGPKLAAITRWYEGYYDIVRDGHYTLKIANLHRQYGPIVRISPYEVHVNDPAFFEKLYRHEGRWDKYSWTYDAFVSPGAVNCTMPHDLHKARRQPLNGFFSKPSVYARQSIILSNLTKFCDRISSSPSSSRERGTLDDKAGIVVPLGAAISALTRDIASEFVLDKTYASLDQDDYNVAVTNMLQSGGAVWRIAKHLRFFGPMLKSIPLGVLAKISDEGTKRFFQYVQESQDDTEHLLKLATASSAEASSTRTIVHAIVDSKLPPGEKKLARVSDEVGIVTGAGFETSAAVLRLIFYHVFANKDILVRLRAELATAGGVAASPGRTMAEPLKLKTLEQLPYLTSIIMEGMRLSPALASRLARIAPDRDLFYQDVRIPAGTPVGMTTLLMHTDETLYPSPLSFLPDRWMDLDARKKAEKTYAPFARGTRMCLGLHLAWAEMYLIISHVVHQFDIDFPHAQGSDFELKSDQFIIGTKGGAVLDAFVVSRKT